jgi:3D (Asp-Asp-Asp) domain-containing protein
MRTRVTGTFRCERVAAVIRALAAATLLALTACASLVHPSVPPPVLQKPAAGVERSLRVSASAYNSVPGQTDHTPSIGAWGDELTPGMKVIAVSTDLIEMGLARGQSVRIRGLDGVFTVADRMSDRWERKIDIYMGDDVKAARNWGVREVEIVWTPEGN